MAVSRKSLILSSLLAASVAASGLVAAPSFAQQSTAGRYTMHQTDDGMLRLDTHTGAVSLCSKIQDSWACKPMADENASTKEIDRLRNENSRLRAEVDRLDKMLGLGGSRPGTEADPPRPGSQQHSFRLPSEKEVDQALNYFERMLKKFQDRLKKLEQGQGNEPKQL